MVTKKSSVLGKISVVSLMTMFSLISPSAAFADGLLDTTFGTGGFVTTPTPIETSNDQANSVVLQSDGKIVVAGYAHNGNNDDFAVARYNTNGSLDETFGTGGIVTTPIGTSTDRANSVVLQSDGKIVVAGYARITTTSTTDDIAVARYNTNGSLDETFGTGGFVTTPIGTSTDRANSVVLQSDGKIVVAGYASITTTSTTDDIAVARYNTNGSLDTTFDTDGKVTTPIGTSTDRANSVVLQSDGKIVVAGYASNGTNDDFAVARYYTNGSLDTTFDTDGKVTTPIGTSTDLANSVVLQSDGKIVVAGSAYNGNNDDFAVARYYTNGSLDITFGTGGFVTTPIGTSNDRANSVVLQSDGKIMVAGYARIGSYDEFAVARYNTDGVLDITFGTGGFVTTSIGISNDRANSVVLQSDGKIVVAGSADNGSNNDIAVARYSITVSGADSSSNGLIWVGAQSTSCPAPNPWVKEKLGFATNAKPILSSAENSVGKTITQSSYDALKTSGVAFDAVSKKVSTATETLPIYGCKDKLLSGKINQPIQFIAGGYTLQSDAHGYINTADQKWHDINAVTLYTNTAAFMHTVKFTKAGKYVVVLTEQPDTSAGLIPTYGVRSIRFVINVN
jgi:uncharacterized delta-60 repeat protein